MFPGKLLRWLFIALVSVIALPTVARAQSAIGGTVKDTSGAVLPGVTVEVASDVLIEKDQVGLDRRPGRVQDRRPAARRLHRHLLAAGVQHLQA